MGQMRYTGYMAIKPTMWISWCYITNKGLVACVQNMGKYRIVSQIMSQQCGIGATKMWIEL